MTIYSLDILLFLFGTSLLFHVQFELLLPDLHTDFSRGRSGGLVFPSLSEISSLLSALLKWNEVTLLSHARLCDPVDCSLQGSSVPGIFQARVLEWVAISFSRGSSDPGIKPGSPTLEADTLTSEPPGKPRDVMVSDKLVILTVGLITLRNDHFFKTFFIFPIWNMFVPSSLGSCQADCQNYCLQYSYPQSCLYRFFS